MPTSPLDGEFLYYAARGERGAPVVFLHGAGSNHLIWNAQMAALAGSARAYALDLPGHGRSSKAGRGTVRGYADAVCSFLDTLSIERAVIAGHSMGGAVAQTLGLENPDRVLALVLVGTGARLRVLPAFLEGALNDFANTAHQFNEAEFAPAADSRLRALSEQQLLICDPQVFHGDLVACHAFDNLFRVQEIRAPALVICGTEDRMTPVKYSQYLAAKIPDAQLRLVEGAGHLSMVEKPDEVNHALLGWIPSIGVSQISSPAGQE
jgi:pimeloyl-ACP methyl ester carboxylesterase